MIALAAILPPEALTRYDDHGEPRYTALERVLLVLRRMDWATAHEIIVAMGADPSGARDGAHDGVYQALTRMTRDGRLLRRQGHGGHSQYRLNPEAFTRPPVMRPKARKARCSKCERHAAMGQLLCMQHARHA